MGFLVEKSIKKEEKPYSGRSRSMDFRRIQGRRIPSSPFERGSIQPPTEPLIHAKEVTLDLNVQYLAGGGAGLLPVKLRGEIRPKIYSSL